MPYCIVNDCPHSNKRKSNLHGVALHPFPSDPLRLKQWLQQINPPCGDLDAFTQQLLDGKKYELYRVCSSHFSVESYFIQDSKKVLRADAVPTIFPVRINPTRSQQRFPQQASKQPQTENQTETLPKCIVSGCRPTSGGGSVLHIFPNDLHRIKQWLQQAGQNFDDLDAFAQQIQDRKKSYDFCMCSSHFTTECYTLQGTSMVLRADAIPTIFQGRVTPAIPIPPIVNSIIPPPPTKVQTHASPAALSSSASTSSCASSASFFIVQDSGDTPKNSCSVDASTSTPVLLKKDISTRTDLYHKVRNTGTRTDPYFGVRNVGTRIDPYHGVRNVSMSTKPTIVKDAWTSTFFLSMDACTSTEPEMFTDEKSVQWPEYELNYGGEAWKIQHDHHYQNRPLCLDHLEEPLHINDFFPLEDYPPWYWTEKHHLTKHYEAPCGWSFQQAEVDFLPGASGKYGKIWTSLEKVMLSLLQHLNNSPLAERNVDNKQRTERLLNQALEVIYLLTGEEWMVVKKNSLHKSIHQLTGEVPVKCGDIAVYFSMDEWEYVDEHRHHYQDLLVEEHLPFNNFKLPEDWDTDVPMTWDTVDESCKTPCSSDEKVDSSSMSEWCPEEDFRPETSDDSTSSGSESISSYDSSTKSSQRKCKRRVTHETADSSNDGVASKRSEHRRSSQVDNDDAGTEDGPHWCNACDLCFPDKHQLVIHQTCSIKCRECGKHFDHKSQLVKHWEMHRKKTVYSCMECGKQYKKKNHLLRHEQKHTRKKTLKCKDCGKRFDYQSQLVIHQRAHTGERPYMCKVCGIQFGHKCSLIVHQKKHTGEIPYKCDKCNRQFEKKAKFNRHIKMHDQEVKSCPECGKNFKYKASLVKHMKTHNK
ncbi:uncharacterized protein WCC33_016463 [Rhinophrynus dorsalis]